LVKAFVTHFVPPHKVVAYIVTLVFAVGIGFLIPTRGVTAVMAILVVVAFPVFLILDKFVLVASIFLLLPLLPLAPTVLGPVELLFASCTLLLLATHIVSAVTLEARHPRPNRTLIVYVLVLLATLPLSLSSGVTLSEWFRGFAPLAAVLLYIPFSVEAGRPDRILLLLAVAALLWDIRVLHAYITQSTGIGFRSTYALSSAALPLSAFGAIIGMSMRSRVGWILAGVSFAAALTTASRGLIVSLVVASLALLFKAGVVRSRRTLVAVVCMALIAVAPLKDQILPTVSSRFTANAELDLEYRRVEANQAVQAIKENPFLGRGLGWSFDGGVLNPVLAGLRIPYLHNSVTYFAMATGVLGVVAYHFLVVRGIWLWLRRTVSHPIELASGAILITIALYGLFQAMFRLFHTNVYLALALAVILQMRERRQRTGDAAIEPALEAV
jgi:hypothetical protein